MTPPTEMLEAETREEIDAKLFAAGWVVQDEKRMNLMAGVGVVADHSRCVEQPVN